MQRGKTVRSAYMVAYALMIVAGGCIPLQLKIIPNNVFEPLWWAMSAMLAIGALISFGGQLRRRWLGEWIGLPPCAASLFSLGLLQAALVHWNWIVIPSLALLWSLAAFTFARWRDLHRLYAVQLRVREMEQTHG